MSAVAKTRLEPKSLTAISGSFSAVVHNSKLEIHKVCLRFLLFLLQKNLSLKESGVWYNSCYGSFEIHKGYLRSQKTDLKQNLSLPAADLFEIN